MNHWHKSLLVTGQPGSVAVLKELGGDVRVGVSKYWLPKRSGVFQPSVPLSPHSSRPGESSLLLSIEHLAEKQLYRMHLYNSGKALG